MADWAKFANLLGMAQYGDAVRATEEKKRKEGIEAEQLGFQRSANQRAERADIREQDTHQFDQQQRPALLKKLQQQLDAGEIDIKEARNRLSVVDATGGAQGAASRMTAEERRKDSAERRADRQLQLEAERLGISKEELKLRKAAEERDALLAGERLTAAQRENRIGKETEQSEIEAAKQRVDPKIRDSQKLAQLVTLYNSVTDEEAAAYILAEIKRLMAGQAADAVSGQATAAAGANPNAGVPIGKRPTKEVMDQWGYK